MKGKFIALLLITTCYAYGKELPVVIKAKKVVGNLKTEVKAKGSVFVKYKNAVITGDRGIYDRKRGVIEVWGNVVIKEGQTELHCKSIYYNLKTKKIVLEKVEGFLSPTDRIKADRIVRVSQKEWIAYDGEYTPCSNNCPDWSVGAKKFKILIGESFAGELVSFKVREIPILITPYLSGPIVKKRKSGFLFPRFGYVSKDGFVYKQPFYLVLGRSADLTLTYEKRSINGSGKGAQLRYVLGVNNEGEVNYYQINRSSQRSWKLTVKHDYTPSEDRYGKLRAEIVSSRAYFKDSTSLNTLEQTQLYTKSDITGSKLWKHAIFNANAVYLRYLDGRADTVYQKLPNLQFYLLDVPISKTPLTFNFYSNATYFYRKAGGSSYRINLNPSVKVNKWLGIVKNTGELSYLYTYYQLGGTRKLLSFKDSLKVNKFYSFKGLGLSVNPELTYSWVESKEQENLPFYDTSDRISGRREISPTLEVYGYRNGKRLFRLFTQGKYSLGSRKKEVKGDLELTPVSWLTLRESLELFPGNGGVNYTNTYLDGKFKGVEVWSNLYDGRLQKIKYLKWGFSLPLNRYLSFSYSQRYDVKNSKDRERDYRLSINRGCWNGILSYKWVKNYDNTISYQIMVAINLMKLGTYGYKLTGKKY
ncbi:LPS-assembly protein LptD [Thermovibrio sp.]